eukprot:gene811-10548_t
MTDSDLSEFEPYDCYDDLEADLERYTQSQTQDPKIPGWKGNNDPSLKREELQKMVAFDQRDPRGKIAIQILPKTALENTSSKEKNELRKLSRRAPSIEERMAKFAVNLPRELKTTSKSLTKKSPPPAHGLPPCNEDDKPILELNRKQRFRLVSDTLKPNHSTEEISTNAARKSNFISDNFGLSVVEHSRSGVHKNHESSLNDHIKEDRSDSSPENAKSTHHRLKMQPVDGAEFPFRRKTSQGRKGLCPADEYQQQLSRFGTKERLEGGKQTQDWIEQDGDHSGHQKITDQITDRSKNLSYYGYNKKADIRLSSSAKVAAVIKEGIREQGTRSLTQQLTGASTQLSREHIRTAKGGIYFPPQLQRSKSFEVDPGKRSILKSGFVQKDIDKITADAAGKSPIKDLSSQTERASIGIYSGQHKVRSQASDDGRNLKGTSNTGFSSRKSEKVFGDVVKSENSKLSELLRSDRSTHSLQRPGNPGVVYSPTKIHGNTFQNIDNSSIKSQAFVARARKNSSGFVEPRKIISAGGTDRGKLVEKNNNTVWNTDSGSGSSEEERTIETDSSTTSSVIDERRRRRLVKRTRRRGLNSRKSQLSQFIGREVSAIESQTSDDGTSRPSVSDTLNDALSPDESIGKINSRESYKRAKQIFEKHRSNQDPQRATPKGAFTNRTVEQQVQAQENATKYSDLNGQSPPFSHTEDHTAMSTIHSNRGPFTNSSNEARNGHEPFKNHRKHSGGTFSAVAKVSKITIPSLQLRNLNTPNRPRYTSDTESYAGHAKILSDPFSLGRRSFRDNNLGFSDGEHELTARLERNEEFYEEQSFDDSSFDRRCYTLPRNMGRKTMKASPFKLNLPGRSLQEPLDVQCNSQSSIEDVSVRSFPLTQKDFSPNRIQSRSAGYIGIDPLFSSEHVLANAANQQTTTSPTGMKNHFNIASTHSKPIESEIFAKEESIVNSNAERIFYPETKSETRTVNSSIANSIPSPFYAELLAPPDNFKDSPDERVLEDLSVEKPVEKMNSPTHSKEERTTNSVLSSSPVNESSKSTERTRGRPPVIESAVTDKSHERAGSPRRRPSYVKAQFSDSMFWSETKSDSENHEKRETVPASTESVPEMFKAVEPQPVELASTAKDSVDQKKKRARPRIPPTLGPLKPSFDDLIAIPIPDQDFPSPEKEEIDKLNCDDNHNLRETSLIDDKLIASVVDKKQEKSDIAKRRPRTTLAATPMLEEIPEEKGHGSGSDTNIAIVSDETRITSKRTRKQAIGELKESVEGNESPKTERSEKAETGYFSSSSTLNRLGSLDEVSESPTFNVVNFAETETFNENRVLELIGDANGTGPIRSHSEPVPGTLSPEPTTPSAIDQGIEPKWSSSSVPNLASATLTPLQESKRAVSTNEVQAEPKEEAKVRKGSTDSDVRSPVDSPFEPSVFPDQRSDSQKSFSSTSSVPQSPVTLSVPKAEQKHALRNLSLDGTETELLAVTKQC